MTCTETLNIEWELLFIPLWRAVKLMMIIVYCAALVRPHLEHLNEMNETYTRVFLWLLKYGILSHKRTEMLVIQEWNVSALYCQPVSHTFPFLHLWQHVRSLGLNITFFLFALSTQMFYGWIAKEINFIILNEEKTSIWIKVFYQILSIYNIPGYILTSVRVKLISMFLFYITSWMV